MIDNYDSFTYNLVHYFESLQQEVKVLRNNEVTIDMISELKPEFIVISPGPCDPNAAGMSLNIIEIFAGQIPILGVCLGHQCIAQHYGGKVIRANKVMHGKTSLIEHDNKGLFNRLNNPMRVTRYHSLTVEKESLPNCFEVTAETLAADTGGKTEIMAIKHRTLPIVGVQFHPESILTEQGHELLENFINTYKS